MLMAIRRASPKSIETTSEASGTEPSLLTGERRVRIGELLARNGSVRVNELSRLFGVTEVTVRNDLDAMAREGLLVRDRGGAIAHATTNLSTAFEKRALEHAEQKRRIGRAAAALVDNGETIILDAGSTVMEMARNLTEEKSFTVVTTALNIATQVGALPKVHVLVAGGFLSPETISTVGAIAERDLERLTVDKLFLSTQAFDVDTGLTDISMDVARVKAAMIRSARRIILLADSSKWGLSTFAKIAPLAEIDVLITDDGLSEEARKAIRQFEIELIEAD
jgi:DeoR family transcriptional regulator, aga operon transcriptional repressor